MADAHLTLAVVSGEEGDRRTLAALAHAAGLHVDTVLCADIDALRQRCEGDGVEIVAYFKLHGSLIGGIDRDEAKYRAVEGIVAAARGHGIQVIASQVEHGTELTALYRIGVDFAQGYLIAEPSETLEHDIGVAEVLG